MSNIPNGPLSPSSIRRASSSSPKTHKSQSSVGSASSLFDHSGDSHDFYNQQQQQPFPNVIPEEDEPESSPEISRHSTFQSIQHHHHLDLDLDLDSSLSSAQSDLETVAEDDWVDPPYYPGYIYDRPSNSYVEDPNYVPTAQDQQSWDQQQQQQYADYYATQEQQDYFNQHGHYYQGDGDDQQYEQGQQEGEPWTEEQYAQYYAQQQAAQGEGQGQENWNGYDQASATGQAAGGEWSGYGQYQQQQQHQPLSADENDSWLPQHPPQRHESWSYDDDPQPEDQSTGDYSHSQNYYQDPNHQQQAYDYSQQPPSHSYSQHPTPIPEESYPTPAPEPELEPEPQGPEEPQDDPFASWSHPSQPLALSSSTPPPQTPIPSIQTHFASPPPGVRQTKKEEVVHPISPGLGEADEDAWDLAAPNELAFTPSPGRSPEISQHDSSFISSQSQLPPPPPSLVVSSDEVEEDAWGLEDEAGYEGEVEDGQNHEHDYCGNSEVETEYQREEVHESLVENEQPRIPEPAPNPPQVQAAPPPPSSTKSTFSPPPPPPSASTTSYDPTNYSYAPIPSQAVDEGFSPQIPTTSSFSHPEPSTQIPEEGEYAFDDAAVFGNDDGNVFGHEGGGGGSNSGSNYGEWTGESATGDGYDYLGEGYSFRPGEHEHLNQGYENGGYKNGGGSSEPAQLEPEENNGLITGEEGGQGDHSRWDPYKPQNTSSTHWQGGQSQEQGDFYAYEQHQVHPELEDPAIIEERDEDPQTPRAQLMSSPSPPPPPATQSQYAPPPTTQQRQAPYAPPPTSQSQNSYAPAPSQVQHQPPYAPPPQKQPSYAPPPQAEPPYAPPPKKESSYTPPPSSTQSSSIPPPQKASYAPPPQTKSTSIPPPPLTSKSSYVAPPPPSIAPPPRTESPSLVISPPPMSSRAISAATPSAAAGRRKPKYAALPQSYAPIPAPQQLQTPFVAETTEQAAPASIPTPAVQSYAPPLAAIQREARAPPPTNQTYAAPPSTSQNSYAPPPTTQRESQREAYAPPPQQTYAAPPPAIQREAQREEYAPPPQQAVYTPAAAQTQPPPPIRAQSPYQAKAQFPPRTQSPYQPPPRTQSPYQQPPYQAPSQTSKDPYAPPSARTASPPKPAAIISPPPSIKTPPLELARSPPPRETTSSSNVYNSPQPLATTPSSSNVFKSPPARRVATAGSGYGSPKKATFGSPPKVVPRRLDSYDPYGPPSSNLTAVSGSQGPTRAVSFDSYPPEIPSSTTSYDSYPPALPSSTQSYDPSSTSQYGAYDPPQPPSRADSVSDSYASYPTTSVTRASEEPSYDPYAAAPSDGNLSAPSNYSYSSTYLASPSAAISNGVRRHSYDETSVRDPYSNYATPLTTPAGPYGTLQRQSSASSFAATAEADLELDRSPAPIVSFGFGGRMVLVFPGESSSSYGGYGVPSTSDSTPTTIHIRKISEMYSPSESTTFPGPIFMDGGKSNAGKKRKESAFWLDQRVSELEEEVKYLGPVGSRGLAGDEQHRKIGTRLILVKLVKALVENEGKLSGTPKIDEAVRSILVPHSNKTDLSETDLPFAAELAASASLTPYSTGADAPFTSYPVTPSNLDKISSFLLRGERREAVKYALDHRLWAHAFVISSCVDTDCWKEVVTEFLKSELAPSLDGTMPSSNGREGLRVAYSMFAGFGADSVHQFVPARPLAQSQPLPSQHLLPGLASAIARAPSPSPVSSVFSESGPATDIPNSVLDKWQETVAMIIANRTSGDSAALTALGDTLKANGWLDAAHICFLLSPVTSLPGGLGALQARMSLIGSEIPTSTNADGIDLESIMLTELVEFALSLVPTAKGQEPFIGFPHLQAFRLYHAFCLADSGHVSQAQRYTDAIANTVKLTTKPSPFYHAGLIAQVKALSDRLVAAPGHDKSGSWITRKVPKPTIDSLWNTLEGSFSKFVAGEGEVSAKEVFKAEAAKQGTAGAIGPFTHYSSISPGSTSGTLSRTHSQTDLSLAHAMSHVPLSRPPSRLTVPHPPPSIPPAPSLTPTPVLAPPPSQAQVSALAPSPSVSAPAPAPTSSAAATPASVPIPTVVVPSGPPPVKRAPFRTHHSRSSSLGFAGYNYDPTAPPPWQAYVPPGHATTPVTRDPEPTPRAPMEPLRTTSQSSFDYSADISPMPSQLRSPPAEQPTFDYTTSTYESTEDKANGKAVTPVTSPTDGRPSWWGAEEASNMNEHLRAPVFATVEQGFAEDDAGFISPMAAYTPSVSPAPASAYVPSRDPQKHRRTTTLDELEDLGIGNSKSRKPTFDAIDEQGSEQEDSSRASTSAHPQDSHKPEEKPAMKQSRSWLGGWFKREASPQPGPGPIKAKLGEDTSFVYDPQLKRWVNKKAGAENSVPLTTAPPPRASTASPTRAMRSPMPPRFMSETPPPMPAFTSSNSHGVTSSSLHVPPPLNRSKTSGDLGAMNRSGSSFGSQPPPPLPSAPPVRSGSGPPPPMASPGAGNPPGRPSSAGAFGRPTSAMGNSGSSTPVGGRRKPLASRYVPVT